jgi:hypothetical protein
MRVPTIDERFHDFLNDPATDCWLALRERLVSQTDFAPYSPAWRRLEDAFAAGRFEEVLELSEPLARRGCLSPRFHFLVGVSAEETGALDRAAWEKQCTRTCLTALLKTGSGTLDDPYLCTYPWDSYDILRALGSEPRGQRLVQRGGGWFDVLATDDEQDYWFDVTDLLQPDARRADDRPQQAAHLLDSRPL